MIKNKRFFYFFLVILLLINCNEHKNSKQISSVLIKENLEYITISEAIIDSLEKANFRSVEVKFDSTMNKNMPKNELKKVWNGLIRNLGQLNKKDVFYLEKTGEYTIAVVRCEFSTSFINKIYVNIKIVFNKSKEIAGLYFLPG